MVRKIFFTKSGHSGNNYSKTYEQGSSTDCVLLFHPYVCVNIKEKNHNIPFVNNLCIVF